MCNKYTETRNESCERVEQCIDVQRFKCRTENSKVNKM